VRHRRNAHPRLDAREERKVQVTPDGQLKVKKAK